MRGIPARDLTPTDVLEVQAITEAYAVDGIPIDSLERLSDGRVRIGVTLFGVPRHRVFNPDEIVYLKGDEQ